MVKVCKKPAANVPYVVPTVLTTPRERCVCGGALHFHSSLQAKCIDLIGVTDMTLNVKACCRRNCRAHHLHNYMLKDGKKINTVKLSDLEERFFSCPAVIV